MASGGYYLLFLQCDKCRGEAEIFMGGDRADALAKSRSRKWKQVNGQMLCVRCAPAVVCRFCNGSGCIACQGERQRAMRKAGMKLVK